MRRTSLVSLLLLTSPAVSLACDPEVSLCRRVVVWPIETSTGQVLGAVEAPVERLPRLAISRYTGQPVTVLYGNPESVPDGVDPGLVLMPLPHVRRSATANGYATDD